MTLKQIMNLKITCERALGSISQDIFVLSFFNVYSEMKCKKDNEYIT